MPHPIKDRTNNLKKRLSIPWFVYDVLQSAAPRWIKCTILAIAMKGKTTRKNIC